jgi:hypothetical protein
MPLINIVNISDLGWWRRHGGVWGVVVPVVEEEEVALLYSFVRFCSDPGWTMGGRGAAWRWWDYVADNVRLGKEEEVARHREYDDNNYDDDNDGYGGGGHGGGAGHEGEGKGKKGKRFV